MKKAEVQQVFTYILVIMVVGVILLLGLRSILNIMNKACDVNETSFKLDLERLISRNTRYGNLAYEAIKVPCDYDELCFISSKEPNCEDIDGANYSLIKLECQTKTGNNIFAIQGKTITPLFAIENIKIEEAGKEFFCVEPRGNRYYLKFEGIGQGQVKISPDNT